MKNKKQTDNDIIKALECCNDSTCKHCPMSGKDCIQRSRNNAIDFINRLQAQAKEKDDVIKAQADTIFLYESVIKDKTAEIERLTKLAKLGNKRALRAETEIDKMIVFAKSKAVKEFAERLCEGRVSNDPVVIAVKTELKMMESVNYESSKTAEL